MIILPICVLCTFVLYISVIHEVCNFSIRIKEKETLCTKKCKCLSCKALVREFKFCMCNITVGKNVDLI